MTSSEPKLLLIETSGSTGKAGLSGPRGVFDKADLNPHQRNASGLLVEIDFLLKMERWKPSDLDAVIVSSGPGSYTGLRVGLMTAKSICYALNIPLIAIPTFDLIAWYSFEIDLQNEVTQLEVVGDAQQDRLYIQRFARNQEPGHLRIVEGVEWRSSLTSNVKLTGPGLKKQVKLLPETANVLEEHDWEPNLLALKILGNLRYRNKQFAELMTVEPLYLRASSAEEQWAAMGK